LPNTSFNVQGSLNLISSDPPNKRVRYKGYKPSELCHVYNFVNWLFLTVVSLQKWIAHFYCKKAIERLSEIISFKYRKPMLSSTLLIVNWGCRSAKCRVAWNYKEGHFKLETSTSLALKKSKTTILYRESNVNLFLQLLKWKSKKKDDFYLIFILVVTEARFWRDS